MKRLFKELMRWAETEDITVEVDSNYYEFAKVKEENRIINGTAGADGYITIYCDKKNIVWTYMTSMLIHEIGHVILFQ